MRLSIALLAALVAVCSAVSNPIEIVPVQKAYIYKFISNVFVGTKEPDVFASRYDYSGNLRIAGLKPNLFEFAIHDVLYQIHNGQYKSSTVDPATPAPVDASALTIPFHVETDQAGKVVAVLTNSTDLEWSVNMKKAIAYNFQITALEQIKSDKVTEDTIYGSCDVRYQVLSQGETISLIKSFDPSFCQNSMHLKESKDFVSMDNGKMYELEKKDGKYRIKTIRSEGEIFAHPKGIKNENAFVSVTQRYDFVKEEASELKAVSIDQSVRSSLKYTDQIEKCRDVALQNVVDVSGGRHVTLKNVLIQKIEGLLEQIVHYFDENHIKLMKPEMKNINLINQILFELENADLGVLEQIFALLQEKSKTDVEMRKLVIFVEILPFIGSRASAIMIRNLIRKDKIDDGAVVQRVLSNLPDQIECPTEKLLFELEDMMNMKFENDSVYEVSLLSYAALIRRTFEDIDENSIVLEKYIDQFEQKFTTETDYSMKMLYLECLGNIKVGSVTKRLMKILETESDTGFRAKVLQIMKSYLTACTDLLVKTTWPILVDQKADAELRLVAYLLYVSPKEPTVSHFMNLYWLMRYEPNERIYAFHYTTMKALSKNPEFFKNSKALADIAKMVLRISRKPMIKTNEGLYVAEKVDNKNGMGFRMEVTAIVEKNQGHVGVRLFKKFNEEISEIGSVYGVHSNNTFHIVTHRQGRSHNMIQFSSQTPDKIFYQIFALLGGGSKDDDTLETLLVPMSFEKVVPNDIGAPVKLYDRLSVVLHLQLKIEKLENLELDFHIRHLIARSMGMKSYNPVNDLWHGIQELKTIAGNIPINGNFELDDDSFKLVLKSNQDESYVLGAQYYGESQVFVENLVEKKDQELLGVGDVSEQFIRIGREFVKPKEMTIIDDDIKEIGKHIKIHVFECDRDISLGKLMKLIETRDLEADFLQFHPSLLFEAGIGSCGFGIQVSPIKDIDRLEFLGEMKRIDSNLPDGPKSDEYSIQMSTVSKENATLDWIKIAIRPQKQNTYNEETGVENAILTGELSNANMKIPFKLNHTTTPHDFELNFGMTLPEDSYYSKREFSIRGMRSDEQTNTKHILSKQCKREFYDSYELMPVSRKCFKAETSLRKYVLKSVGIPKTGEKRENEMEVIFPLLRDDEIDVRVDGGEMKEGISNSIEELDMDDLKQLIPPYNLFFGPFAVELDNDRKTCVIGSKYLLKLNNMKQFQPITDDYVVYFNNYNTEEKRTVAVSAKRGAVAGKIAFRFESYGEVTECEPSADGFDCKLNGVPVKDASYTVIKSQFKRIVTTNPRLLLIEAHGILLVYDGLSVRLEMRPYVAKVSSWYGDVVNGLCVV